MSDPVYTLVLLPPKDLGEKLVQLSQNVARQVDSDVVLGVEALPHITVVQWQGASLDVLRRTTSHLRGAMPGPLTLAGISVVPGPEGDNWIELPVLSTDGLRRLQGQVLSATEGNGIVANGVNDRFRPHVTVGLTYSTDIRLPPPSADLLRVTSETWTSSLGVSGPNYTLTSLIEWDE